MKKVFLVDAARTAVGSFLGSLKNISAAQLGAEVIKNLVARNSVVLNEISEVILGQVLVAGQGQNPARLASIKAGLHHNVPAYSISHVCGSGMKSIMLAAQSIALGQSSVVIAGGQESMSQSQHSAYIRQGAKMGDSLLSDTMMSDGLLDAFENYHMGITAENVAEKWSISRDEQDEFAVDSQNKAEAADKAGRFNDEIIPIEIKIKRETQEFKKDEFIRFGASKDKLSSLKPVFKKDGTVTAGNASGINDGAAMVLLAGEDAVREMGLTPIAEVKSYVTIGVDPSIMGIGPVEASKKALKLAGWNINDLDVVEANEAFAAQAIAVNREMGWNTDIVNRNGGAIAIGHPIGASGARIVTTLVHQMKHDNLRKGLATLCIGGGMGNAICFEKV